MEFESINFWDEYIIWIFERVRNLDDWRSVIILRQICVLSNVIESKVTWLRFFVNLIKFLLQNSSISELRMLISKWYNLRETLILKFSWRKYTAKVRFYSAMNLTFINKMFQILKNFNVYLIWEIYLYLHHQNTWKRRNF